MKLAPSLTYWWKHQFDDLFLKGTSPTTYSPTKCSEGPQVGTQSQTLNHFRRPVMNTLPLTVSLTLAATAVSCATTVIAEDAIRPAQDSRIAIGMDRPW